MSAAAIAASADTNFSSALNAVNDIALPDGFSSWSSGRKWSYLVAVVLTVSVTAASTAVAGAGLSNDQARVAAVVLTAVGTVLGAFVAGLAAVLAPAADKTAEQAKAAAIDNLVALRNKYHTTATALANVLANPPVGAVANVAARDAAIANSGLPAPYHNTLREAMQSVRPLP